MSVRYARSRETISPSVPRNSLQSLGLTRYEIPIDSRIAADAVEAVAPTVDWVLADLELEATDLLNHLNHPNHQPTSTPYTPI
jgi:hypothetical protein